MEKDLKVWLGCRDAPFSDEMSRLRRQDDVCHLDRGEFGQDLPGRITQMGVLAFHVERLEEHIGQEAHQDVRLRPLLFLVPNRTEAQIVLTDPKGGFRLGELNIGLPEVFAALSMATGKVIGSCKKSHTNQDFLAFLKEIDRRTPKDLELHLVLDNYGTHKHENVTHWLEKHPRFHMHVVPTGCSWLNLVERFFAQITNRRIPRGTFESVAELEDEIADYLKVHNANPKPFKWTATAEAILENVTNCRAIYNSQH